MENQALLAQPTARSAWRVPVAIVASLGLASKSFGAESEAQDMPAFMARELQQLNSKLESVVAALGSLGQRQGRIESELLAMNRPPKPGNRDLEA